jgi:periplasmic divalent cation tolerance protein
MNEIVVLTTCKSDNQAELIARHLVDKRLAACVNILPAVRSIYRWEGNVEEATEVMLLIKTRSDLFADLQAAVTELHSYEVPELIALPIVEGSNAYLAWLNGELRASS